MFWLGIFLIFLACMWVMFKVLGIVGVILFFALTLLIIRFQKNKGVV